jgi:hypothetical protein
MRSNRGYFCPATYPIGFTSRPWASLPSFALKLMSSVVAYFTSFSHASF